MVDNPGGRDDETRGRRTALSVRLTYVVAAALIVAPAAIAAAVLTRLGEGPGGGLTFWVPVLFVLCLATAAVSLAIARHAFDRLNHATRAMRELAQGRTGGGLSRSPLPELDAFITNFNAMADQVQKSRRNLMRQAFQDPLTGLANRASFMHRLSETLAQQPPGSATAVLFVDLDRFKMVNDTLGHGVGDNLLTVIASRLRAAAGDDGLVARLGGDEFTIVITGPDAERRALEVAGGVIRRIQRAISVGGHEIFISASIGISVTRVPLSRVTEILRQADIALYKAKEEGRGRYVIFEAALHEVAVEQIDLSSGLHRAVERDQFRLVYQPEVDVETGAVVGMEALLRWDHPHLGVISPSQFIAIAEETGEIANIGRWVLETACREAVALAQRLPAARNLTVGVNLSATEFRDPSLASQVNRALRHAGLPASQLRLELTENVLVEDVQSTVAVLKALREIGVQIAIDDFGTGYSSLSYIQWFDVETLKIDQSFVSRIGSDPRSDAIINAITELARSLNMSVTAEGVETAEQLAYLVSAGCQRAQGHYLAYPLEMEQFEAYYRESLAPSVARFRSSSKRNDARFKKPA